MNQTTKRVFAVVGFLVLVGFGANEFKNGQAELGTFASENSGIIFDGTLGKQILNK